MLNKHKYKSSISDTEQIRTCKEHSIVILTVEMITLASSIIHPWRHSMTHWKKEKKKLLTSARTQPVYVDMSTSLPNHPFLTKDISSFNY